MLLLRRRVRCAARPRADRSGGAFHASGDSVPDGRPVLRTGALARYVPPGRTAEEPLEAGAAGLRPALRPGPARGRDRPLFAPDFSARPVPGPADRRDRAAD